jgi:hypothetical protein
MSDTPSREETLNLLPPLEVKMDEDVRRVAQFMQRNMQAAKLVNVAKALALLAPALWGQHQQDEVQPLCLLQP